MLTRPRDDANLLKGMQAGNVASFEALYDRFHPLVYAIGIWLTHTSAMAEEITERTFLDFWRERRVIRPEEIASCLSDRALHFAREALVFDGHTDAAARSERAIDAVNRLSPDQRLLLIRCITHLEMSPAKAQLREILHLLERAL